MRGNIATDEEDGHRWKTKLARTRHESGAHPTQFGREIPVGLSNFWVLQCDARCYD